MFAMSAYLLPERCEKRNAITALPAVFGFAALVRWIFRDERKQ